LINNIRYRTDGDEIHIDVSEINSGAISDTEGETIVSGTAHSIVEYTVRCLTVFKNRFNI
jgi:hypothetical protein